MFEFYMETTWIPLTGVVVLSFVTKEEFIKKGCDVLEGDVTCYCEVIVNDDKKSTGLTKVGDGLIT